MTKRTPSKASPLTSKLKAEEPKSTKLGRDLISSAKQILAHVKGEIELESYALPRSTEIPDFEKAASSEGDAALGFLIGVQGVESADH